MIAYHRHPPKMVNTLGAVIFFKYGTLGFALKTQRNWTRQDKLVTHTTYDAGDGCA